MCTIIFILFLVGFGMKEFVDIIQLKNYSMTQTLKDTFDVFTMGQRVGDVSELFKSLNIYVFINKTASDQRCKDLDLQLMTSFLYPDGNVYNGTFDESYSDELPVMISGLEFQLCETSVNKTLLETQLKDLRAFETNKTEFKNVYWAFQY